MLKELPHWLRLWFDTRGNLASLLCKTKTDASQVGAFGRHGSPRPESVIEAFKECLSNHMTALRICMGRTHCNHDQATSVTMAEVSLARELENH